MLGCGGPSGRGGSPELEQVVGQANELPFGLHLGDASQGELAETAGLLDLTEHWLDLSLSFFVGRTPVLGSQRTGHTLLRGERSRDATAWYRRQFFVVFQSLRRDVRNHVVGANALRVVVAVVARVGHEIFWALSDLGGLEVGFHLLEQRGDLSDIVGLRRDIGGNDELRFIDQHLGIATWVPALVRRLHDLRVGVGEVALSLRFRLDLVEVDRLRLLPFGGASGVLRLVLGGGLRASLLFQRRRGFANLLQARLATLQFVGQFIAATVRSMLRVLGLIFRLRLSQQFANLLLQPSLFGLHAVVAHRAV